MNPKRAKMIARDLMNHHGLHYWLFEMRPMKSLFGYCHWSKKLITLSTLLTELNDEPEVINTILHEIAHALAPKYAHHGPAWKAIATGIGCSGTRCYPKAVATPQRDWKGTCPVCPFTIHRYRRRNGSCPKCNPRFDRRFMLKWTEVL